MTEAEALAATRKARPEFNWGAQNGPVFAEDGTPIAWSWALAIEGKKPDGQRWRNAVRCLTPDQTPPNAARWLNMRAALLDWAKGKGLLPINPGEVA